MKQKEQEKQNYIRNREDIKKGLAKIFGMECNMWREYIRTNDFMEFMIGCNYWGSKYGIDMWKYWDEDSIRQDLQALAKYGVKYMVCLIYAFYYPFSDVLYYIKLTLFFYIHNY